MIHYAQNDVCRDTDEFKFSQLHSKNFQMGLLKSSFQMVKRKIDYDLNDLIGSYLKKRKCEKSLKLLEETVGQTRNGITKMMEAFFDYLKEKEIEKRNVKNDDLDFEINFGAYQLDKKVSNRFKGDLVARMGILDEVVWNKFYGSGGVEDVGNRE